MYNFIRGFSTFRTVVADVLGFTADVNLEFFLVPSICFVTALILRQIAYCYGMQHGRRD